MGKKWYSFFVVTDGKGAPGGRPAAGPRRAADVAPEAAAPPVALDEAAVGAGAIDDVYRSARIEAPPHGYTVLKVAEMLESEHIRALPADVKRKSVMVALEAAGVAVDDIVADAVRRDQALDTYERVLEKHLETLRAEKAAENARLESDIATQTAQLRARIDENNLLVTREQDELLAWRARKQQAESTIAEAVGHFVTENPITAPPQAPEGDSDVR